MEAFGVLLSVKSSRFRVSLVAVCPASPFSNNLKSIEVPLKYLTYLGALLGRYY